jgi:hypothetical protein
MENKLFEIIPEAEEMLNFAKFEAELEFPGRKGKVKLKISLLDEEEIFDLFKKSGEEINPQDMMARSEYMKIETLVKSITKIGTKQYKGEDFTDDMIEQLDNELRYILHKSSPAIIQYIYDRYNELYLKRNEYIEKQTEEYKKKFQEKVLKLKPL